MGSLIECSRTLNVCASAPSPFFYQFVHRRARRGQNLAPRYSDPLGSSWIVGGLEPWAVPSFVRYLHAYFLGLTFKGEGGCLSLAPIGMVRCSDLETFVRRQKLSPRWLGSSRQRAIQDAPGLAGTEPVSPKGHCWRLQYVEGGGPSDRARIGVGGVSLLPRSQRVISQRPGDRVHIQQGARKRVDDDGVCGGFS